MTSLTANMATPRSAEASLKDEGRILRSINVKANENRRTRRPSLGGLAPSPRILRRKDDSAAQA